MTSALFRRKVPTSLLPWRAKNACIWATTDKHYPAFL